MKITINTEVKVPLEIGENTFYLDFSDSSIDKMQKEFMDYAEKVKSFSSESKELESLKPIVKDYFDFVLGEGSFDKIYNQFPSMFICADIASQVNENIFAEIEKRSQSMGAKAKVDKYLKGKK